ncbi:hypothetical protein HDC36_004394 [Xanthomonas sp. JAI131]|nr:hypothetical protein [Xanthomonas sp. JAI131]
MRAVFPHPAALARSRTSPQAWPGETGNLQRHCAEGRYAEAGGSS